MKTSYTLLLDIGNTNTKIAVADKELLDSFSVPSHLGTADLWGLSLLQICSLCGLDSSQIGAMAVSSVVPALDSCLRAVARRYFQCPVLFVPADLPLPFDNMAQIPATVGADRLIAAYSARQQFTAPNLIILDFGTATTLDCMQGNTYMGCVIAPGIKSSATALSTNTARLPQLDLVLKQPEFTWPEDTESALNAGFIFGFADMADGLCRRTRKLLGPARTQIIATGGLAATIAEISTEIETVVPDLLLQGLAMAFNAKKINSDPYLI